MTKKSLAQKIEIMQAYDNGANVMLLHPDRKEWVLIKDPVWNWQDCDYELASKHVFVNQRLSKTSKKPKFHPQTIDASLWAKEFCLNNSASDEGTMLAWFASAIMAGMDEARRRIKAQIEELHI